MPTLDTTLTRLHDLLGVEMPIEELEERLFQYGMELEGKEGDDVVVDITPDRPDMLSAVGLARALRLYNGISVPEEFRTSGDPADFVCNVDPSVLDVRPHIGCAIIRGLSITEEVLKEIIWVQEKLHNTYCRKRKVAAIGVYPLGPIQAPITYSAVEPSRISFTPLDAPGTMDGNTILSEHPTGKEYAGLLEGMDAYPLIQDSTGRVLSMPPIINSEELGRVQPGESDIFLEVTGTRRNIVENVIHILSTMFHDMGGVIEAVKVVHPDYTVISPDFTFRSVDYDLGAINSILGIELTSQQTTEVLAKMGYLALEDGSVGVPPYRTDVLHHVDIIDDISRGLTFDSFEAEFPEVPTTAALDEGHVVGDRIRELMVGLGFNEAFTMALSHSRDQMDNSLMPANDHIPLTKAKAREVNMLRANLTPELLKSLRVNRGEEYPQRLFEMSDVVLRDDSLPEMTRNIPRIASLMAGSGVTFTEAKSTLSFIMDVLGVRYSLVEKEMPWLIPGRSGRILLHHNVVEVDEPEGSSGVPVEGVPAEGVPAEGVPVGWIGEIHPQVLTNFTVEMPVSGFELNIERILRRGGR